MKLTLSRALFFLLFIPFANAFSEVTLNIVQPYEGASLPSMKQSFVFGSVQPSSASVTINGVSVTPYSNGGFLTMIPFQEGKFQIQAVATDGVSIASVTRTVNIAVSPPPFTETDDRLEPISPQTRVVMRGGDTLDVSCQGAPNGTAQFHFKGESDVFPMEEISEKNGLYKGSYTFKPGDSLDEADIIFTLKRKDGKKLTAKAGAKVTLQRRRTPRIVELKENSIFLTGPGNDYGYNLFGLPGTRLEVTGEWGDFVRVAIGEQNEAWVRKSATAELPAGSIQPKSISRNIRIDANAERTLVTIPLQFRHAYRAESFMDPFRMRLTLYGVIADTDRMKYLRTSSVIKEINWFQNEENAAVFDIQTKLRNSWGYDIRYEGKVLILEIRHRPVLSEMKTSPLKGLRVAVDAGHSSNSFGTIGPWGNTEASVCLMVAKVMKQALEKRGAEVVMIQDGTKEISLQDRTDLAWEKRAHFYISIHADACAEGQNPREVEGYSVHYYQPHSRAFAEAVHKHYGKNIPVTDQGLWRSNLAVCRSPQIISILLEQGFLMLPEFEERALSSAHQNAVAESVIAGIQDVLDKYPE